MIYLDNAATTPLSGDVLAVYNQYAQEKFFNPSAMYNKGVEVSADIASAKQTIAKALGVKQNSNIIFTSSATEANNLAVFGSIKSNFRKLVFSSADHPSIKNVALELKNRGMKVEYVPLQENGEIDYFALENILDEQTDFISIIHVSNETGAINDLKKIYEIKKQKCPKAIFHVDGVQAFSKIKVNLDYFGVDLYTISGHKIFAPKGVAALYVRDNVHLKAIMFGGGQEHGIRSGTENVPAIMAFKKAVEIIGDINDNYQKILKIKKVFLDSLGSSNFKLNSGDNCSPYIVSLSFEGVKGETLLHMLEKQEIYISTGSACSSKKVGNSVLEAMSIEKEKIIGSVRISFSKNTTLEEAKTAGETLKNCYIELKEKLR